MKANTPKERASLWAVVWAVLVRSQGHHIALAAAGVAFYATLALFPAVGMLISVYGLAFDPADVERQLGLVRDLVPPAGFALIEGQVRALVARPRDVLNLNVIIGGVIALWSASAGTKAMLIALDLAYGERETRSILRFQATALAMTVAAVFGAALAVALLVALPAAAMLLPLPARMAAWVHLASLGLMMLFVGAGIAFLFRVGPDSSAGRSRRVLPGMLTATLLWVLASGGLSIYITDIAHFDITYGPLAAIAGVMLWFWISCYAVLAGAELNSALERRAVGEALLPEEE